MRGLGTSIVAETLAAVTFMHGFKGCFGTFYLSYAVTPTMCLVVEIE